MFSLAMQDGRRYCRRFRIEPQGRDLRDGWHWLPRALLPTLVAVRCVRDGPCLFPVSRHCALILILRLYGGLEFGRPSHNVGTAARTALPRAPSAPNWAGAT